MQLLQTSLSIAMCAAGALIVAIGTRQLRAPDITRLPIISPRGKHVLGLFLILVGVVIFFSQFVGPKRAVRPAASPAWIVHARARSSQRAGPGRSPCVYSPRRVR